MQPGLINEACGIRYAQFVIPNNVSLKNDPFKVGPDNTVTTWMELITPTTANVLAWYNHPVWGNYAAVTQNNFGKGMATYVGCFTSKTLTEKIVGQVLTKAGLWGSQQAISFPVIIKNCTSQQGKNIHFIFNYSAATVTQKNIFKAGTELLSNTVVEADATFTLAPWDVKIIEEK